MPSSGAGIVQATTSGTTRSTNGTGGFAILETPERFVRASVLRTLAQWEVTPSPELVEDLTQDGLLACWQRRHAPHIQNFPRY